MIQRSLVILIILGHQVPIHANPPELPLEQRVYHDYQTYTKKEHTPEELKQALMLALEKDKDPSKPFDNAHIAARIQNDLIEAQKSWFQRHYRVTTIGIPFLTFVVVAFSLSAIKGRTQGGNS